MGEMLSAEPERSREEKEARFKDLRAWLDAFYAQGESGPTLSDWEEMKKEVPVKQAEYTQLGKELFPEAFSKEK